jgi:uncharacterized protein (DUF885 family)
MEKFPEWMNAATDNFREGINNKMVLPKKLVVKMIPQMRAEEITTPILIKIFSTDRSESFRKISQTSRKKNSLSFIRMPSYRKLFLLILKWATF